jgi:uncharacterized lipoprotein YddW (UPF0748 family)
MAVLLTAGFIIVSCGGKDDLTPEPEPVPGPVTDSASVSDIPVLPAHELRGVWVATVSGLDWPQGEYSESEQKSLYISFLNLFKSLNINAVFFQVRPDADAFYKSEYEPWSKYITGTADKDPGYDVLKFLVDETHSKGMQFHAWINPYRIASRSGASASFPALDSRIPSAWIKDYNKVRVYNPALPQVRDRIAAIVKDLVTRYDVDGIHMDDYFYPSLQSGESMNDEAEYAEYGSAFSTMADFRRSNVSIMVQKVQNAIITTRPEVIFTISPQGNYNNNYNTQYIDVPQCCSNRWIDAVIPQLYWSTSAKTDYFTPRLDWWASNVSDTPLMIGYGIYRFGSGSDGFSYSGELQTEFNLASSKSNVVGGILYRAKNLVDNKLNINSIIRGEYKNKALPPYLGRTTAQAPGKPSGIVVHGSTLSWQEVEGSSRYAVYKDNGNKKKATLIGVSSTNSYVLSGNGVYFVTALSETNAESGYSDLVAYSVY